jgi:hypothetical protein
MPRTDSGRSTPPRLATLGPGLLALGLAAAGCADDTPRAASADLAASRKAAAGRGDGFSELGPTRGDVAPVRTRAKGDARAPGRQEPGNDSLTTPHSWSPRR